MIPSLRMRRRYQACFTALRSVLENVSLRVRVGALLLLASSTLLTSLLSVAPTVKRLLADVEDPVARHENRLKGIREALPARGVIGYTSDAEGDELVKRYYMTQYALLPVLVAQDTQRTLVIGDYTSSSSAAVQRPGLVVLREFGEGLVLLSTSAK